MDSDQRWSLTVGLVLLLVSGLVCQGTRSNRRGPRILGPACTVTDYPPDPLVFLTVSSLASVNANNSSVQRQLELNWNVTQAQVGDWVGLFSSDPTTVTQLTRNSSLLYIDINETSSAGHQRIDIQFNRYNFTIDDLQNDTCLDYWIAYVRNITVLGKDCLKTNIHWMREDRNIIGSEKLKAIFIPGTHNAGSWGFYNGQSSEDVITRLVRCQDEIIWNQLIFGIRYLDFRIGYYPNTQEKWWLNHDMFRLNSLAPAIQEIKNFINNTAELLIIDFHRFPVGFLEEEIHRQFISYVVGELGEFMVPYSEGYDITANRMWQLGKRVLVSYNDQSYNTSNFLWPPVSQMWAETNNISRLLSYLDDSSRLHFDYFWAGMAQLTPSRWDVLLKKSIRTYADSTNRLVTDWYRRLWWDSTNVVAVDYLHGTDIVNVARAANRQRATCRARAAKILSRTKRR